GIVWTVDSKSVFITSIPMGLSPEEYLRRVLRGTPLPKIPAAPLSTVSVYDATSEAGPLDDASPELFNLDVEYLHDLVLVNVETGETTTLIRGRRIGWYAVSPDGAALA